jgi:hypothetical protein
MCHNFFYLRQIWNVSGSGIEAPGRCSGFIAGHGSDGGWSS